MTGYIQTGFHITQLFENYLCLWGKKRLDGMQVCLGRGPGGMNGCGCSWNTSWKYLCLKTSLNKEHM